MPQEAIEELNNSLGESIPTLTKRRRNAIILGIEALEFFEGLCEGLPPGFYGPLPSEKTD